MIWSDLRKCDIKDIVGYINEKLEEHGNLTKVAHNLNINESTIRQYITKRGYKRVGNIFVEKNDTCNTRDNTYLNKEKTNEITKSNTNVIDLPDLKENMVYLSSETETLKDMIEWFKAKNDKSNTSVIEVIEGIKIDLPQAPIKRTTIRINEKIWDMFNELVEDNKPIDKHDLMGMALLEYITKYKK